MRANTSKKYDRAPISVNGIPARGELPFAGNLGVRDGLRTDSKYFLGGLKSYPEGRLLTNVKSFPGRSSSLRGDRGGSDRKGEPQGWFYKPFAFLEDSASVS